MAEKIEDSRLLSKRQLRVTLGGVLLAMFLASLDQTVVGTAMPRIISDLGGFSHYTWVTTSYLIASTVAMPISGKLIDSYGRKPVYVTGLVIFLIGSLLSGLSNSMMAIVVWRGVQGIGAGVIMTSSFTIVADLFPPSERGKYQGIMSGTFGLSSVIGPGLGGFLTDSLSWHWVFFINIPLGILILVLFVFLFPDFSRAYSKRGKTDYWGAVVLVLAVVPAMLALSWGGVSYPWLSTPIISTFAFSAAMTVWFIAIERRTEDAIIPLSLFRHPVVVVSELIVFFTSFGMFASIVFIPLFFQGVQGLSATASGSFLTPMLLGMVGGSIVSGQLLSRTSGHYRIQGVVGLLTMAAGLWLLSSMNAATSQARAVVYMVITGTGIGATMPLYVIAIQNVVPHKIVGAATASTSFIRSVGASIGLAIFGSVLTNRFAGGFIAGLPPNVRAVVPEGQLEFLSRNPQALVNAEAQDQLRDMFGSLGSRGPAVFEQTMQVMRRSLDSAISGVFLIGMLAVLVAFVLNLFLKEIPLRKENVEGGSVAGPGKQSE
ncbi:MAG: MFS transporter [Chloroflexi bacterium]|nr:MFS transporter [Chloroflexota bacterium]